MREREVSYGWGVCGLKFEDGGNNLLKLFLKFQMVLEV